MHEYLVDISPLLYIWLLCDEVLLPWNSATSGFDVIGASQDPPNEKEIAFSYCGF